ARRRRSGRGSRRSAGTRRRRGATAGRSSSRAGDGSRLMADWGPWVDLAYDDEDMADNASPTLAEKPQYPYGLRGCFTGRELELFGLALPRVGATLNMRAMLEVTCVSDGEGGQRVEWTIVRAKLESEDEEED